MKQPDIIICECGCLQPFARSRTELVRNQYRFEEPDGRVTQRAGRLAWVVGKTCKAAFELELLRIMAVENVVRENVAAGLLRRLAVAAQIYDLTADIHRRTKGERLARRLARRAVVVFLAPRWLGLRLDFSKIGA